MTPAERINIEESVNTNEILLHPEGMFYRAYERSAYLITRTIKAFKPTKHYYKNIGGELVFIGFPRETFKKYIGERSSSVGNDGTVTVQSDVSVDESAFQSWKDSVPLTEIKDTGKSYFGSERLQVFKESYGLLIHIYEAIVNIQKDYKGVPGDDIRRSALHLVQSVVSANDSRDDTARMLHIGHALSEIETIKLILRIFLDLKQVSSGCYMTMSKEADSVTSQLKAWSSYTGSHAQKEIQAG